MLVHIQSSSDLPVPPWAVRHPPSGPLLDLVPDSVISSSGLHLLCQKRSDIRDQNAYRTDESLILEWSHQIDVISPSLTHLSFFWTRDTTARYLQIPMNPFLLLSSLATKERGASDHAPPQHVSTYLLSLSLPHHPPHLQVTSPMIANHNGGKDYLWAVNHISPTAGFNWRSPPELHSLADLLIWNVSTSLLSSPGKGRSEEINTEKRSLSRITLISDSLKRFLRKGEKKMEGKVFCNLRQIFAYFVVKASMACVPH